MNFTLIPFFLAAQIATNDTNTWIHGPEYIFEARISYVISINLTEEPLYSSNITSTLKCRPKAEDSLLCRLEDTMVQVYEDYKVEKLPIDDPFEVKFNERGIQELLFQRPIPIVKLNIVRSIATQLSIGADIKENTNALPAFMAREHFLLGNCATFFTVMEYANSQNRYADYLAGNTWNYDMEVLPLPERKLNSDIVIEKRTDYKRCMKSDDMEYNPNDIDLKLGKSLSKIHIGGTKTYKSQSEIHVKISRIGGPKDSILRNIIDLELKSIEPAKEELPRLKFAETASVFFGYTMHYNFIL